MPKHLELMALREKRIGELVERIRQKSRGFKEPPIVVIGGYALRAYIPFTRYSRDCDFALPKGRRWNIDKVNTWLHDLSVEAREKFKTSGYLRAIELVPTGKRELKIALDFMEGAIRGRNEEGFLIDSRFLSDSIESRIRIGENTIPIRVPSFQDYFLLKLLSGRPSDVRDIAALIWKKGMPKIETLRSRASENFRQPQVLIAKLDAVIADVSHDRFLDSWRGTFITEQFTKTDNNRVLDKLRKLKNALAI